MIEVTSSTVWPPHEHQLVCFWIITKKNICRWNEALYIVDVGVQWLQRLGEGRVWPNCITGRTREAGAWTDGENRTATATLTETLTSGKSWRHLCQWCHWSSIAIISDVTYHDLISVRHWLFYDLVTDVHCLDVCLSNLFLFVGICSRVFWGIATCHNYNYNQNHNNYSSNNQWRRSVINLGWSRSRPPLLLSSLPSRGLPGGSRQSPLTHCRTFWCNLCSQTAL